MPLGVVEGFVVYSLSDGALMAARIDIAAQKQLGPPIQLGVNVFARGGPTAAVSPAGKPPKARPLLATAFDERNPRVSPDGK